jgi:hypothetical protein
MGNVKDWNVELWYIENKDVLVGLSFILALIVFYLYLKMTSM